MIQPGEVFVLKGESGDKFLYFVGVNEGKYFFHNGIGFENLDQLVPTGLKNTSFYLDKSLWFVGKTVDISNCSTCDVVIIYNKITGEAEVDVLAVKHVMESAGSKKFGHFITANGTVLFFENSQVYWNGAKVPIESVVLCDKTWSVLNQMYP